MKRYAAMIIVHRREKGQRFPRSSGKILKTFDTEEEASEYVRANGGYVLDLKARPV